MPNRELEVLAGIFFMALTLAIVSFSCTGPILGTLIGGRFIEQRWPDATDLWYGGFWFGVGLTICHFCHVPRLVAITSKIWWMAYIGVKVVLGFLELAMAMKFLSNADLVEQWGILKREIFIAVWVMVGILLFYIFLERSDFRMIAR